MKTNIINILFLIMFALTASSVPVTTGVRKPGSNPIPNAAHELSAGKYYYTINGIDYSQEQVDHSIMLWAEARRQGHHSKDLSEDQEVGIEGRYLAILNDVPKGIARAEIAQRAQCFMKLLLEVILTPESQAVTSEDVVSLARITLRKYLALERQQGYGHLYPNNGHPVDDDDYLKTLLARIEALVDTFKNGPHQ